LKIAVTGATGFVGRHLLPALLARGAQVVAASRDPARVELNHERLAKIALDLDGPGGAFARLGEPDVLLHLAWGGLPNYASAVHLEHELPRQLAFLRGCAEQGLRRLVVAGTCLEYGMQSGCLAEDAATAPVTAYGRAKDELHKHLRDGGEFADVDLTWLRLFYVYGPGQAATSLYSQLRAAVAAGASEFPMSPGDQQRDFLSIEAAAGMMARLALGTQEYRIVNVCSGRPMSVLEMARERLREWGAQLRLLPGAYPYPDFETMAYWGDTRRLTAALEAK
jgi:dTDP-6-deoxy-L-talose 4-dehydrogenase (NAD+)